MLPLIPALVALAGAPAPTPLPGDFVRSLSLLRCGDANGDGVRDLAIGLPRDDMHGEDSGRVFVLSGKDGSLIRELHAGEPHSGFGFALAACADFDGDGKPDLAVAAHRDGFAIPWPARSEAPPARVYIFTLATGELRRTLETTNWILRDTWASTIHPIGDMDEDGSIELLVASREEADVSGGHRTPLTITSCKKGETWDRIDFDGQAVPFLLGHLPPLGGLSLAEREGENIRLLYLPSLEPWESRPTCLDDFRVRTLIDLGDLDADGLSETAALGAQHELDRCEDVRVVSFGRRVSKPWFEVHGDDLRAAARTEASSSGRTLDVCSVPDLDADGCAELFVMLPGAQRSMSREEWSHQHPGSEMPAGMELRGFGAVVSSRSGKLLWTALGTTREPLGLTIFDRGFGEEVQRLSDVDGDGLDDIGVAACYATTSEPYEKFGAQLRVLSAKDGRLRMSIDLRAKSEPRVTLIGAATVESKPK